MLVRMRICELDRKLQEQLEEAAQSLARHHRMFCEHYLGTFNATQSALDADGLNPASRESAAQLGYTLLQREDVQSYLRLRMSQAAAEIGVSPERVLKRVEQLAFSNICDVLQSASDGSIRVRDLDSLPKHVQQSIKKIRQIPVMGSDGDVVDYRIEVELYDALSALKILVAYLGIDTPVESAQRVLSRIKELN